MLTDKERQYQAKLARYLNDKKRADKARNITAKSGNVSCYLSGMSEDKKADMGFYYCPKTSRINQLKYEIAIEIRKQSK